MPGYTAFYQGTQASKKAEEPICLNRWIDSKMGFEFPVMFERTRIVVRLYEIMNMGRVKSRFVLDKSKENGLTDAFENN